MPFRDCINGHFCEQIAEMKAALASLQAENERLRRALEAITDVGNDEAYELAMDAFAQGGKAWPDRKRLEG
jgi:hypothetical protein